MKHVMVTFSAPDEVMAPVGTAPDELERRFDQVLSGIFVAAGIDPVSVNLEVTVRDHDPVWAAFIAGFSHSAVSFNAELPFDQYHQDPSLSSMLQDGYALFRRQLREHQR